MYDCWLDEKYVVFLDKGYIECIFYNFVYYGDIRLIGKVNYMK